jgi:recombination protein RecT
MEGGTMSETAVAVQKKTIRGLIESPEFAAQVEKALPRHIKPDRFIRVAITAMTRTPKLMECTRESFFNSLLTLSQLGLEPDGYHAHLIPYKNNKTNMMECQLIIDYKGLVDLTMRSGKVANIHADVVCEEDEFSYNMGMVEAHRVNLRKPRGEVYAAYAVVTFKDGTKKAEVMSRDDIEAIRKRSRAGNNGPWVTDWNEMAKKTVFRRLAKWLPISPEYRDILDNDFDRMPDMSMRAAEPRPLKRGTVEEEQPVTEGEYEEVSDAATPGE